jgi:hypothetical protein
MVEGVAQRPEREWLGATFRVIVPLTQVFCGRKRLQRTCRDWLEGYWI